METIREFGLDCLQASGEEAAVRRSHARYFVRLAEGAEPHLTSGGRLPWLVRLAEEQNNLRMALHGAVERDEAESGLRIVGALWLWYWLSFREEREVAMALLVLPSAASPTLERGRALVTAAPPPGVKGIPPLSLP